METFSIQKLISDKLRANQENREIKNWHASGLGTCMTGRYLARLGVKPDQEFDDRTLRVFSVGNLFEDWIVNLLKGINSVQVETQGRVESKELDISGRYDLKITKDGKPLIYELKSKQSKAFWYMSNKGEGASPHNKMQLWLYLYLTGVEEGRLVYISKDDLSILEYPIFRDDKELKDSVLSELDILNRAWEAKLPPNPIADPKDWRNRYCNFHKQCISQEKYLEVDN